MAPTPSRTLPRPTRRAAGLLVLLAVATVAARLDGAVVAALAGAVVAGVVVDAVALSREDVVLATTSPRSVVRGARALLRVEAVGAARVSRLRQPSVPEVSVEPPEARGPHLEAALVARHRGAFALPPAVARVLGPLGLASVDVTAATGPVLESLPDLPRGRRLAVRRRGASGAEGAAVRRLGLGTEFESVRDYDPNDDVRFVNWMASSRCGRPMTNQYRVDENRDLLCLVDTGRLMCSPVGDASRLDVALDAVCVLGAAADAVGDRVGATAFHATLRREVAPRRRGTEQVVASLFDLQPAEVDSDFPLAFQQVAVRKRSIVAVFTDLVDPAASRTLLEALPILERRHVVVVASVRDEALATMATTAPAGYEDVARMAASIGLLEEHREVRRRVAALGGEVVVASADDLGVACVRAYARVKARARA